MIFNIHGKKFNLQRAGDFYALSNPPRWSANYRMFKTLSNAMHYLRKIEKYNISLWVHKMCGDHVTDAFDGDRAIPFWRKRREENTEINIRNQRLFGNID